ncbi:protein farnesyltransferase subunit beta [Coffea eugenioides]|uniref:protein farnesyltransferase subunit beta n=1 Tax=Coffea eugenioides TaxID=49369 RepID=UPI000F612415|nr:protein farnesyltransferase subunit beta [Coffea eugenioides]
MESSRKARGTKTQEEQWMVENDVGQIYSSVSSIPPNAQSVFLEIRRDNHIQYLMHGLNNLGPSFSTLDANRPWICYWILHSIALLGDSLDEELEHSTIEFLSRCQDPDGGYGGGPGQMPHLATTYAAVNSLITLGGPKSLSSINRGKLRAFLLQMKDASGGFRMHDGGEVDVRACYTAISVASVLNILDDELTQNVGDYILSCQTYEGGIAGEPGSEAHGGYTFCGLAAMILINEVHRLDLPCLIDWVVFRQGVEGGFQGRTNKLVDGCYSFWQGGVAVIVQKLHSVICEQLGLSKVLDSECDSESYHDYETSDISDVEECTVETSCPLGGTCHRRKEDIGVDFISNKRAIAPIFSSMHLQQYLLLCSQEGAGFRDKPGKPRDHYHTCYCLSGLSVCQYCSSADADSPPLARDILGPYSNLLEQLHPLYNLVLDRYYEAHDFFSKF